MSNSRLEVPYYIIRIPRHGHTSKLYALSCKLTFRIDIKTVSHVYTSYYEENWYVSSNYCNCGCTGNMRVKKKLPLFSCYIYHLVLTLNIWSICLSYSLSNIIGLKVTRIVVRSEDKLHSHYGQEQNQSPDDENSPLVHAVPSWMFARDIIKHF